MSVLSVGRGTSSTVLDGGRVGGGLSSGRLPQRVDVHPAVSLVKEKDSLEKQTYADPDMVHQGQKEGWPRSPYEDEDGLVSILLATLT